MTKEEFLQLEYTFNMTYEEFCSYNKHRKVFNSDATKVTICAIDFNVNRLAYNLGDEVYSNTIDEFLISVIKEDNLYISNPSSLKKWKGFEKEDCIFLGSSIISYVDKLIPKNLQIVPTKENCSLRFKIIRDKKELKSYLLRCKLAYDCGQIEEHFWYVKKDYNVVIISDKTIYTPIDSERLFSYTPFCHIDLHNINFQYTKSFSSAFRYSNCLSVDFGENPKTSSIVNLEYMFDHSNIQEINLQNWDLSNVKTMYSFCSYSKVKNVFINVKTPNLCNLSCFFYTTHINKTNIEKIDTHNVTDMSYMFFKCSINKLNLSGYNIKSLECSYSMFHGSEIKNLVVNWKLNKHLRMDSMFSSCYIDKLYLNLDITHLVYNDYIKLFYNSNIRQLTFVSFNKQTYSKLTKQELEEMFCFCDINELILDKSLENIFSMRIIETNKKLKKQEILFNKNGHSVIRNIKYM